MHLKSTVYSLSDPPGQPFSLSSVSLIQSPMMIRPTSDPSLMQSVGDEAVGHDVTGLFQPTAVCFHLGSVIYPLRDWKGETLSRSGVSQCIPHSWFVHRMNPFLRREYMTRRCATMWVSSQCQLEYIFLLWVHSIHLMSEYEILVHDVTGTKYLLLDDSSMKSIQSPVLGLQGKKKITTWKQSPVSRTFHSHSEHISLITWVWGSTNETIGTVTEK